ncbi:hypothetical protein F0U61_16535 [Archangium violaceum]|nr:hypothetical protein F0U61_16535 [Archangium violaceum]
MLGLPHPVFWIHPPFFFATPSPLFTDCPRGAGIQGLNKAVWGVENRVLSAHVSELGGGRP